MVIGSDWRIGPSAVERSAAPTTAAMASAAETLQSHLEFVLDERVGSLNPDQRRFLDVALRYGDRLVRLVEDMRTIALAESGELDVVWSRFDLAATTHAVAEQVWPVAHVEGKTLDVHHEGPVLVDADERRLARALLALVSDAVDLARPGTTVTMAVRDGKLELTYEGDEPPSETALALAEAIAGLHAGDVSLRVDSGTVALGLRLEARTTLTVAA
jgi:two-component system, OmpR family, sensor histidine kinase AdeS